MASPNLLRCMQDLIAIFHHYSGKEGDKFKLNKAELKELLEKELCGDFCDSKDPKEVNEILEQLDNDKDGEVDFCEFISLVAALTVATNDFFEGYTADCGSKKK